MGSFEEGKKEGSSVREALELGKEEYKKSAEATAQKVLQRTNERLSKDVYYPMLINGHVKVNTILSVFCSANGQFSIHPERGYFEEPIQDFLDRLGKMNTDDFEEYDRFLGFFEGLTMTSERAAKQRFEASLRRRPEDIQFEVKATAAVALIALFLFLALW